MTFDPEQLPVPDLGLCCLKCGYGLAGLPTHVCPECGRRFTLDEHIPPGDFPIVIFNGSELMDTPETVALLHQYRIPHIEMRGPMETVLGLGIALGGRARIAVQRTSYFEVIDLLRRQALAEPMPAATSRPASDWTCRPCGEENPGSFETCWNCSADRPSP